MDYELIETTTPEEFQKRSVEILKEAITYAINDHDSCIIGLSGGSTPRPIYEALAKEDIDWSKVYPFLLDERSVAITDDKSNAKLILDTLPVNQDQCLFPDTTLEPEECAMEYHKALSGLLAEHPADIVVLGMGEDGHTASLFPPVGDDAFGELFAVHTTTDKFAVHDRISVSAPVIATAAMKFLFLKGEAKKQVWEEMLASDEDARRWPAKLALETGAVVVAHW